MKKNFTLLILILLTSNFLIAQKKNIGISDTGAVPDSSSILDIQSTTMGILFPRMTEAQRLAISSPATGLVVYQVDGIKGFYFNIGTPASPSWILLASENLPPVVNVVDTTFIVVNPTDSFTLSGTATDVDGSVKAYLWSQVSGPKPALITNPGSQNTFVTNLTVGTYIFQLMAIDNRGATGVKLLTVTVPSIELTKGLLAYFPFNNNYNDMSGNGNNGVLAGGNLTADKNGIANSAFNVNGNGQGLVVGNNGKILFDSVLTISFNALVRNFGRNTLVGMIDYSTGYGQSFDLGMFGSEDKYFGYSVGNLEVVCNYWTLPHHVSGAVTNKIIQPEMWHHITVTFNRGQMKAYVNGVLISSATAKDKAVKLCASSELLIGTWWQNDQAASLNGKIDEVRLYNRELNKYEIGLLSR